MRKAPVSNEAKLWELLRGRKLAGLKFRRQAPIGAYVVDFLCLEQRMVIEADGPFHSPETDGPRDDWLKSQGFQVLRFPNEMIATNHKTVLGMILAAVEARGEAGAAPHPTRFAGHLLPRGEKDF